MDSKVDQERGDGHHEKDKTIVLIVNASKKSWDANVITFEQVVTLAYGHPPEGGNVVYTVTFKDAAQEPSSGSLVAGKSVKVKNGTIFNVTRTDKS